MLKIADPYMNLTPEFCADPYPTLARFRQEAPVWWSEKGKYWLVTRYKESLAILQSLDFEKRLDRWKEISPLARVLPPVQKLLKSRRQWMLNMDPPDHTRIRSLVNKAFTPSTVAGLAPHIESIANSLIDSALQKGEMDVISDFAYPLPVTVIAQMLGVPPEDRDLFREFSYLLTATVEVTPSMRMVNGGNKATDGIIDYLRPLVAERRKNPKNDLISSLIAAEEQGKHLSESELLQNCVLLLVAGHETTVNLIGNGVLDMMRFPDQLELIQRDPGLITKMVNETLRFDSPVQLVRRLAGKDCSLAGQNIRKGDMISIMVGAANRDPEVYERPDVFDINREQKRNLAFGQGIHHCIGSSLAETEARIAFSALFKRLPNTRLKAPDKLSWRLSPAFRGVTTLPVVFR